MNRNSSRRDLGVFDFNGELEAEQLKWTPKFRKPKFDDSPLDKYRFLECVAHPSNYHSTRSHGAECVDVDISDDDEQCPVTSHGTPLEVYPVDQIKCTPLGIPLEDDTPKRLEALNAIADLTAECPCSFSHDTSCPKGSAAMDIRVASFGGLSPGNGHISSTIAESPSNKGLVGAALPDAVDSVEEVCTYEQGRSHSFGGLEMEEADNKVVLFADYVAYRDNYWPTFLITFSNSSFRIDALYDQEVETSKSEWGVDDIQNIVCQWNSSNKIVTVRAQLLTRDACVLSGFEEMKFVVFEPNWLQMQEKIISLDARYRAIWQIVPNVDDKESDGCALPGEDNVFFAGPYFPDFEEPFEDVVYPEGDADAVSISKRDVDLLQPETFINDTIIDFYIKYLKKKIPPEESYRFHFFNSFFFRKLADLDKSPSSAFDAKAAFQRVRKWTRKFDLFEKDFVFIPVNYNLHWSLIVICHPSEVVCFKDEDASKSSKVPCILHMDSIRGSHAGLKHLVQSYLWEEWKERQKETSEEISSKFLNLRFISLELPQQENCYDCGLFLLHYVELFVAQAPAKLNPFKITKFSNFLNVDWFMPAEVSLKRAHIQRLIHELLGNRARRSGPTCDEIPSSKLLESNGDENGRELVSERSPGNPCSGNTLYCHVGQVIEMSLLGTASLRNSHCVNEGLALREPFEPGISAGTIFRHYHQYNLGASYARPDGAMSPIEEEAEADEHHVCSPSSLTGFRQLDGLASEPSNIGYTSELLGAGMSCNPVIPEHPSDEDGSSPMSNDNSYYSEMEIMEEDFETGAVPSGQNGNFYRPNCSPRGNTDNLTESSPASSELPDTPAEDSQVLVKLHCINNDANPPSTAREDASQSSHEELGKSENRMMTGADEQLVIDDLSSDSDVERSPKRLRLSLSVDGKSMELPGNSPEVLL